MSAAERVQAYARATAARLLEPVPVPPFTAYLHALDLPHLNYAIPDGPSPDGLEEALPRLRAAFAERGRALRIELVEEALPALAPALAAHGLDEELRLPGLICAADALVDAPPVPGLAVIRLAQASRAESWLAAMAVQAVAFGVDEPLAPADAEAARARYAEDAVLLAVLDGQPVGAGVATRPVDGVSEVAGIGVVPAAHGLGIELALVAACARSAFRSGAGLAFLTPGDDGAAGLYARCGFAPALTIVHLADEAAAAT
ncbi:MAG: GNAT family N-acetyltransferase [Thermoleophilia bacterium]